MRTDKNISVFPDVFARELVASGHNVETFAKLVGVDKNTVYYWQRNPIKLDSEGRTPGFFNMLKIQIALFEGKKHFDERRSSLWSAWLSYSKSGRKYPPSEPQARDLEDWLAADLRDQIEIFRNKIIQERSLAEEICNPAVPKPEYFFGRAALEATLAGALLQADGQPQKIILLGIGGIGKTTLARRIAHNEQVTAHFRGGIWEIDFSTADDAAQARSNLAAHLNSDVYQCIERISQLSSKGPILLLLDNIETPWDRTPNEFNALLKELGDTGAALLATMRGMVSPSMPSWNIKQRVDSLDAPASQQFFLAVAKHIRQDDPWLKRLLGDLAGIPLAIWLMARYAEAFPDLSEPWREWEARGPILVTDPELLDSNRHSSLARSIEVSLSSKRVTENARKLFRWLGASPVGLGRDTRNALLDEHAGPAAALRLLHAGLAHWVNGQLDLLPPLRRYAQIAHKLTGEEEEQLAQVYHTVARRSGGTPSQHDISTMRTELPNLRAMILREIRAEQFRRVGLSAEGFANICTLLATETPELDEFAKCARKAGDESAEACALLFGSLAKINLGNGLDAINDIRQSVSFYRKSRANGEIIDPVTETKLTDLLGKGLALLGNASLIEDDGFMAQAESAFQEALGLFECTESRKTDEGWKAVCLVGLAHVNSWKGNHQNSDKLLEDASTIFERTGDSLGQARCLQAMGTLFYSRKIFDTALHCFEQARNLAREGGSLADEYECLRKLIDIKGDLGNIQPGVQYVDQLYDLCKKMGVEKLGQLVGASTTIHRFSDICRKRNLFETALHCNLRQVDLQNLADAEGFGSHMVRANLLIDTAHLFLDCGLTEQNYGNAQKYYDAAVQANQKLQKETYEFAPLDIQFISGKIERIRARLCAAIDQLQK